MLLPSASSTSFTHQCCRRLFATKQPDWMFQAEIEAIAANKGRQVSGGSPGDAVMSKLENEFQGERVHNTMKLEDKLRMIITKCEENRGDAKLFNAIRKRAIATRHELIVQREAAGMAKNSVQNAATVEATFPIPADM